MHDLEEKEILKHFRFSSYLKKTLRYIKQDVNKLNILWFYNQIKVLSTYMYGMVFQVNVGPTGFINQSSKFLVKRWKSYVNTGDSEIVDSK